MRIQIVNEKDEVISCKEREKTVHEDIRRITAVWVFNKKKEFLIAKRQSTKVLSPNKWGPSVSGTLEEGETYESNAIKETEEEIGLKKVFLEPFRKIFYENINGRRFCYIFTTLIDKEVNEFILQEDEVSEVKWISLEELSNWYQSSPGDFIPSLIETINLIKEYQNANKS